MIYCKQSPTKYWAGSKYSNFVDVTKSTKLAATLLTRPGIQSIFWASESTLDLFRSIYQTVYGLIEEHWCITTWYWYHEIIKFNRSFITTLSWQCSFNGTTWKSQHKGQKANHSNFWWRKKQRNGISTRWTTSKSFEPRFSQHLNIWFSAGNMRFLMSKQQSQSTKCNYLSPSIPQKSTTLYLPGSNSVQNQTHRKNLQN